MQIGFYPVPQIWYMLIRKIMIILTTILSSERRPNSWVTGSIKETAPDCFIEVKFLECKDDMIQTLRTLHREHTHLNNIPQSPKECVQQTSGITRDPGYFNWVQLCSSEALRLPPHPQACREYKIEYYSFLIT